MKMRFIGINVLYWSTQRKLDQSYWQHSTFLGRFNGIVYSFYVDWLEEYLSAKERIFVPQSICSSPSSSTDAKDLPCFKIADTWDNFITDSLGALSELSVELHAMLPPRASEIQVMSNIEPIHVTLVPDAQSIESNKAFSLRGTNPPQANRDQASRLMQGNAGDGSGRDDSENPKGAYDSSSASTNTTEPSNPHIIAGGGDNDQDTNSNDNSNGDNESDWTDDESNDQAILVTKTEMISYYRELINCMNRYASEEYTSALQSCMTGKYAFIHMNGNRYYKIHPRQPFAINKEYMQVIPTAKLMSKSAVNIYDVIIGVFLLLVMSVGLAIAAGKLKLAEACFTSRNKNAKHISRSAFRFQHNGSGFLGNIIRQRSAGLEGGYQKSSEVTISPSPRGEKGSSNRDGTIVMSSPSSSACDSDALYQMVPLHDPGGTSSPNTGSSEALRNGLAETKEGGTNLNPVLSQISSSSSSPSSVLS